MRTLIIINIIAFLTVFFLSQQVSANDGDTSTKTLSLPEVFRPVSITADDNQLYIVHQTHISICSRKDLKLVKTFGKEGEGPKEFKLNRDGTGMFISLTKDHILVNSLGKLSFFTKKGEYIREIKVHPRIRLLASVSNGYVGRTADFQGPGKDAFLCFNLYDGNVKKVKEICRRRLPLFKRKNGGLFRDFFSCMFPVFYVVADRVIVSGVGGKGFDIFDQAGNHIKTVELKTIQKRSITEADKKAISDYYRNHRWYRNSWEEIRTAIVFPEYFPDSRTIFVADDLIYLQSYLRSDKGTLCLRYDLEGKSLGAVRLPLDENDITDFYLHTVRDGILYRLVENSETDEYQLQATKILQ